MSLDNIPTRANGAEIDQLWFNIVQSVLGADLVPRNSGGTVTDQAGGLGTATISWVAAYLMTLKLRAATSGNIATLKAIDTLTASLNFTLPASLPTNKSYMTIDSAGQMGFGGGNSLVEGTSTGNPFHIAAGVTAGQDVCSVTLASTNGGPILVMLLPDYSGTATEILATNSNAGATNIIYWWNRDGTDLVQQYIAVPGSASMGIPAGAFCFIDPSPGAGNHTYKLRAGTNAGITSDWLYLKLSAKEL